MSLTRKVLLSLAGIGAAAVLLAFLTNTPSVQHVEAQNSVEQSEENAVFMGIIIKDNDGFIPTFLKSIEHLDYNKKLMLVQIDNCNTDPKTVALLEQWVNDQQGKYHRIELVDHKISAKITGENADRFQLFGTLKNNYLAQAQKDQTGHCFILESDSLLAPFTLKELLSKHKPVIAPLLRPIPEAFDPFRNFYADATEKGYYKDHPDYWPIADRSKLGTFQVPSIQTAYLIETPYAEKLSFIDGSNQWEFLAFSRNANQQNVPQFICNEREFGSFLHFRRELSEEEEKAFVLKEPDVEVTPALLEKLFSPFYADDPALHEHIKNFNFDKYAIYRVGNRDLFYADEEYDWIKSQYIKKGGGWEENVAAEFKKYAKPGTTALDIGGYMGTHTLNLSRLIGEKGQVHVFEPRLKMFTECVINMHLNGCKNVEFHRTALGDEEKMVQMHLPQQNNQGMARIVNNSDDPKNEIAKMERLDHLQIDNISLVKIDVEGFEAEVIKGGIETILKSKPVLLVEIFQGPDNEAKIKTIEDLGYSHFQLYNDDYLFLPL